MLAHYYTSQHNYERKLAFILLPSILCLGDNGSEWVKHWVKGGHNYYYNLQTKEGTWVEPENFIQNNTQLNKEDIQVGVSPREALRVPGCLTHLLTLFIFFCLSGRGLWGNHGLQSRAAVAGQ